MTDITMKENENITFHLDKDTDVSKLYNFICCFLSFNKVMQLYRLLERDIKTDIFEKVEE